MNSIAAEMALFESQIAAYEAKGLRIFASSSFQGHSIPMLKIIADIAPHIPIYFLNTGYHFPETLWFRDHICEKYGLTLANVSSPIPKSGQRTQGGQLMFAQDPDYCCHMNKTLPMEPVLREYDVWISGLRRDQNENRRNMAKEANGPHGTLRYHPMLDWNQEMIDAFIEEHQIPEHPLAEQGYYSVGCMPCTQKPKGGNARDGRWAGMKKTECGLHTTLIEQ